MVTSSFPLIKPVGPFTRLKDEGSELEAADRAVEEFLARDYSRVVGAVSFVTGDRFTAEDAVQEGLVRAWDRLERGEQIDSVTAWVAVVSMNIARSGVRRRLAERRALAKLAARNSPDVDAALDLRRELARSPRRQRETVVLRYVLGLDVHEIAERLGLSEGAVKNALFHARRRLATALGESEPEEASYHGSA